MKRRARVSEWAVAAVGLALAACAASQGEAPEQAATSQENPPVCRQEGPRYLAFLTTGTCRDVQSSRGQGRWVARPLFLDAPAGLRDSACTYRWTVPATATATEPDVEVLSTIDAEHLTRAVDQGAASMVCEAAVLAPGSVVLAPDGDDGGPAPVGVTGCDVCARVFGRTLFVILPPDQLNLRTVMVTTTGGKLITFNVNVPEGTQAFSVELPSASQDRYNEGRVPLLRAPF